MSSIRPEEVGQKKWGTYTGVNDGNLDSLSSLTRIPELVDLGHEVGGEEVLPFGLAFLELRLESAARRVDGVLGNRISLHGPHILDHGHLGELGRHLLRLLRLLELDRCALEQLELEVLAQRGLSLDLFQERRSILHKRR